VDVDRAPHIPAGVDGLELDDSAVVGDLEAAQELAAQTLDAQAGDVRIYAQRVALPDVDHGPADRLADVGAGLVDADRQPQRDSLGDRPVGGVGRDVRAVEHLIDEEGALCQVRRDDAGDLVWGDSPCR
jgi:hypothetical protein